MGNLWARPGKLSGILSLPSLLASQKASLETMPWRRDVMMLQNTGKRPDPEPAATRQPPHNVQLEQALLGAIADCDGGNV